MNNKIKIFIFLFIITFSVQANDILTNYRINGIKNIEKQMDLKLTEHEYWKKYLEKRDTKFGYIESYSSLLTCNKEKSELNLYSQDNNNTYKFQKKYSAFTGKTKGDKIKEGDLKTPIGVYQLIKKIYKLDSFYGPLAFVTSYPNIYDRYKGKNGSGIWIHGLPQEEKRDKYTKGCIAIDNSNIKKLDEEIDIKNTLLIINKSKVQNNISKNILTSILAQLYSWRYAWLYNDINNYLEFYADDFKRGDGMNLKRFKKYKTRIFHKKESKNILFNNITVIPYPNTKDIYQITFEELYLSQSYKFTGDKVLMVRVEDNNRIKIFTEN